MINIGRFRIDSNNNKKVLEQINSFTHEYLETYENTRYKHSRESLYNDILNIYYEMGLKERDIKRFEPVFFLEYFYEKENFKTTNKDS